MEQPPRPWKRWLAGAVVVLALDAVVLGFQVGSCVDYAAGSGNESTCTSGPAIGMPAAALVLLVSACAIVVLLFGMARSLRGRRP